MKTRTNPALRSRGRRNVGALWLVAALAGFEVEAAQQDIAGPPGSLAFGETVTLLPNGNIVVTDPDGPVSGVGAVHLYSSAGQRISTLTGSAAGDRIGSGGIHVVAGGNFVVASPLWDNGSATDAGAVTWVDGDTGFEGIVTPANSITGSTTSDLVGLDLEVLPNGNFVIVADSWTNGNAVNAGAVSLVAGSAGRTGPLSASNALVGSTGSDRVGSGGVYALPNGGYVVASPAWHNGSAAGTGAVTHSPAGGITGIVSAANSLVGSSAGDSVGSDGVFVLGNGHFVVASSSWNNGAVENAGAVTWCNGATGRTGFVSPTNSLVGASTEDRVGAKGFLSPGVNVLANGHYVVASSSWSNGPTLNVGAATWANGTTGRTGLVSAANSLVGSTAEDGVGDFVTPLTNGHYVVASGGWDNGAAVDAGAATWANGTTGRTGTVSPANSLVGAKTNDFITARKGVAALSNGHYVVTTGFWDNGAAVDVGAAIWCNGTTGRTGLITSANALIGDSAGDMVGLNGVRALVGNGNYVVVSSAWSNGSVLRAGAATWGNGATGTTGVVSAANSLVGSSTDDGLGGFFNGISNKVVALTTGDYVVPSPGWNKGSVSDAGAVTYGFGATGRIGAVSSTNSLTGIAPQDNVGGEILALPDGRYAAYCLTCDNPLAANGGAVTLARGVLATTINSANSVLGTVPDGDRMSIAYDPVLERLIVGRPASNIVSLFTLPGAPVSDPIFQSGFE